VLGKNVWLGDRIVAAIDDADTASPNLYYVVNDYLGRPIRMRDANRVDVWTGAYRPALGVASGVRLSK
jgi:hypothetical protein